MANNKALEKAMGGAPLSERQMKGALDEAMQRLTKEGGRFTRLKENVGELGDAMIHSGETQGTVFLASFAEGYFGEEKMDVGPVDLRLAGGIASAGYGFYNVMLGKGGEHALAVGNGLLSTAIGRVGRNAGKALAEKRDKDKGGKKDTVAPAADPMGKGSEAKPPSDKALPSEDATQGDFGDLVRDIFLTPDEDAAEGRRERRGERVERHRPTRFIRATVAR